MRVPGQGPPVLAGIYFEHDGTLVLVLVLIYHLGQMSPHLDLS